MFDWLVGNPDSTFWLVFDRVSITLSYVVVVTVVGLLWKGFRFWRRRRRLARLAGTSRRPRALALSFGGGTIRQAIEDYLAKAYEVSIPVEEIAGDQVTVGNVHRHLDAVRRLKERWVSEGVTELHLFGKAPVALAVAVGAIFDNWIAVKVYQHCEDGYEAWTTLAQAKATPMAEELAERVLQVVDPEGG